MDALIRCRQNRGQGSIPIGVFASIQRLGMRRDLRPFTCILGNYAHIAFISRRSIISLFFTLLLWPDLEPCPLDGVGSTLCRAAICAP
jgi:hypothetical protein